jgi:CheY-like chemotaxis protein
MLRVLVVDDDQDTRDILRMALEDEGYGVQDAPGAAQALALLRANSPACVVLLDWKLAQGMDGDGVLRAALDGCAAMERHKYVVMTAMPLNAMKVHRDVLTTLGVPVVIKPFELGTLLDVVAQAAARIAPPDE